MFAQPNRELMSFRKYYYVGPDDIRVLAQSQSPGTVIASRDELSVWLTPSPTERNAEDHWIATFTVGEDELLRLAPRRSEHVACASGGPVLSAGEITIDPGLGIVEISNQSTGFCPEPSSWLIVESALDRIGLTHPGRFTQEVVFRLCTKCNERIIVKDSWFHCLLCGATLSERWNFPQH